MRSCDVLIVGGGPAGSSAAWRLRRAGADVLVLDRERFPRLKLCAGWITPEVVRDLEIDLEAYPHRLLTFPRLRVHWGRLQVPIPCVQHSIRRFEFDAWLLERSGAPFEQHNVRHIAADGAGFVVDDAFRCRWLVGAGGTRCPVYRTLFRDLNPRASELQIVTLEHEIQYDWRDCDCHLWFFEEGLPGYSWYVPKENGKPYRLHHVSSASVVSIGRSMLGRAAGAGVFSGRSPRVPGGGPAHGLRHRDQ